MTFHIEKSNQDQTSQLAGLFIVASIMNSATEKTDNNIYLCQHNRHLTNKAGETIAHTQCGLLLPITFYSQLARCV